MYVYFLLQELMKIFIGFIDVAGLYFALTQLTHRNISQNHKFQAVGLGRYKYIAATEVSLVMLSNCIHSDIFFFLSWNLACLPLPTRDLLGTKGLCCYCCFTSPFCTVAFFASHNTFLYYLMAPFLLVPILDVLKLVFSAHGLDMDTRKLHFDLVFTCN